MTTATKSRSAEGGAKRSGRPSRAQAGEVDERILDAAQTVFLDRGFEGASVDEIAEVAHAGKPTIYARFAHKEAIFVAVMERMVKRRMESLAAAVVSAAAGATIVERLTIFASAFLSTALVEEGINLVRVAIAETRRFPDLATSVHRMLRERGAVRVAQLLVELGEFDKTLAIPAFAPDRAPLTAQRFIEAVVLPFIIRALFGEDLTALRAEISPHVRESVAFFLAACGFGEATWP